MILSINSFSNEKIKFVSSLKEKRNREKQKKFFIEGYREILKAIHSKRINLQQLFISRDCFLGMNEDQIIEYFLAKSLRVFEVPRKIFEKISYRDRPDGLVAIAEIPDLSLSPEKLSGTFVGIVEGVEKPGNLGTILRTAEGAGVDAILVGDPKIDLWNPNVVRSSTGTLFTIPVFIGEMLDLLGVLKKKDFRIISVTPESKKIYYFEDYTKPTAVLFGSEQYGLSELAKANSHTSVSIPMHGDADSLNLAMSAGILFYEVVRQRNQVPGSSHG